MQRLISEGKFGRKTGRGFYVWDGTAQSAAMASQPADPAALAGYAAAVMAEVSAYAQHHAGAISPDPANVDLAMQLGYGWANGPLEMARSMQPVAG